jgi:hypothetical protein
MPRKFDVGDEVFYSEKGKGATFYEVIDYGSNDYYIRVKRRSNFDPHRFSDLEIMVDEKLVSIPLTRMVIFEKFKEIKIDIRLNIYR